MAKEVELTGPDVIRMVSTYMGKEHVAFEIGRAHV